MSTWRDNTNDAGLLTAWQELTEEAALQAAQDKPWLLKLLRERGTALATRYALWKSRLGRLRQGERKRLQRRLGVGLAGAALLLALGGGPIAHAGAPIEVDGATCTLAEAIVSANTDTAYGGCTTGYAGADTIYLYSDVMLTASNNSTYGPTGLPVVTSEITIEGDGHTIFRDTSVNTESFRILAVGSGGNLTLFDATLSGGLLSGAYENGAGIYARSATLSVSQSTLSGNSANYAGGGIAATGSAVSVSNSTISGNSAGTFGGGIATQAGTLAVTNSTISSNSASKGGGMFRFSGSASVANTSLSGNTAEIGGGIYSRTASLAVTNSTISGNTASSDAGGAYAKSGVLVLSNSTIANNSANYGGGVGSRGAAASVVNSTLTGNSAGYLGGGIGAAGGSLAVLNSTLSGNSAGEDGGGIYVTAGIVTVRSSTLSGNNADRFAGGIAVVSCTTSLSGNLISGNTAGAYNEVARQGGAMGSGYNLFGHDGEDNAAAFYGFTPFSDDIDATTDGDSVALATILTTTLANNDSTVLAGASPGAVVQTLALPLGSPALDKMPGTFCEAPIFDLDQRGEARNADGDGADSSRECDIGAFELQTEVVPRIIVHKQTMPDGDPAAFAFRLRGPANRNFALTDNQPHSTGQIPAGIYTLEEVLPPGWDPAIPLSALTCDDGSPLSAIDLAADEVLVCRFLNYKRGNIVVKKVTIPPVAAPSFAMRLINNTSLQKTFFSLANTQQFDTGAISSVPTYKLLETVPGGWKKKNIVCSNGSPSTAIALPPGGTVTCTVTNENSAPSNISLSNSSVAENKAIGTLVGNLSATDSVAGDTHTFSFVNDGTPAAANNGNFQIVGAQLKTAKKFDFETKGSHNIKLMVTDSAGQTKIKAFVITIIDGPG